MRDDYKYTADDFFSMAYKLAWMKQLTVVLIIVACHCFVVAKECYILMTCIINSSMNQHMGILI